MRFVGPFREPIRSHSNRVAIYFVILSGLTVRVAVFVAECIEDNHFMTVQAMAISANDDDRRTKLRMFLTTSRSRLRPEDVGLPVTSRRRVTGLRREEVAELTGVSSDWYRWFESGRPIRVSVPFLERLCRALKLKPIERIALFSLALPEIYEALVAHRCETGALPKRMSENSPAVLVRAQSR